ncbi:unnamed protein product [Camellia sinensis]
MNGLHYIARSSSALPLQSFHAHSRNPSSTITSLAVMKATTDLPRLVGVKAVSSSTSSTEMENADAEEEKSEIYSHNMTEAMGAVLTYKHELGMNYNFIRPDLIVGSCLQAPYDVDKLRSIGVKTIFCLQQDSDLEYFGVDITGIREYADTYDDIQHLRAEIREILHTSGDFDAFDLRMRLPAVVSKLHKAISCNGGVTYIHCTAGLGRAPAVAALNPKGFGLVDGESNQRAYHPRGCMFKNPQRPNIPNLGAIEGLAHMFWFDGYKLSDGHSLLLSKRLCCPKLDAIKSATADIKLGLRKRLVTLTWKGSNCSTVEVSGLDIGWGQRMPLKYDNEQCLWILQRKMLEGRYEYKYIIDGEWTCNSYELVTPANKDGHVNNYVELDIEGGNGSSVTSCRRKIQLPMAAEESFLEIPLGWFTDAQFSFPQKGFCCLFGFRRVFDSDPNSITATLWKRLMSDDPYLTENEQLKIRQFLEACTED